MALLRVLSHNLELLCLAPRVQPILPFFHSFTQMVSKSLTPHDLSVLEKIKDPESAPSVPLLIDSSLPRDPHVTDPIEYEKVAAAEGQIIKEFQALEARIAASDLDDESRSCPNISGLRQMYQQACRPHHLPPHIRQCPQQLRPSPPPEIRRVSPAEDIPSPLQPHQTHLPRRPRDHNCSKHNPLTP